MSIDGAIGPEPHPSFIEVLCLPPLGDGYWEVERAGEDGAEVTACLLLGRKP